MTRQRALAVRGADAVGAGVAAAEDDDVLALGGDLVEDLVAGESRWFDCDEVLHGEVHAGQVAPGDRQVARHDGARGDDDRVVALAQVAPR